LPLLQIFSCNLSLLLSKAAYGVLHLMVMRPNSPLEGLLIAYWEF
jgi:hypothetical protein